MILKIYLFIVNVLGFILMGTDKKRAINKKWRIPEKALFFTAFLGGALGSWLGMYVFRHKTRHWYFVIGMPIIMAAQIYIFIRFLYFR